MDDDTDTQWTEAARERYAANAALLVSALQTHVAQTLSRSGRQRELGAYFESTTALQSVAEAFNDAEFDWCGSFPLALRPQADEDDWDDQDDDEEDDDGQGDVLSVLGRWDFLVTDQEALLAAGREAYASTWPDDTDEDAEIAVADIAGAVAALMHPPELGQLEDVNGLNIQQVWSETYVHDGTVTDEDDPFARSDE